MRISSLFFGVTLKTFDMARQGMNRNAEVWMPSNIIAFAIKRNCDFSQAYLNVFYTFLAMSTALPGQQFIYLSI